ncbi:MAG: ATPase, T2SS/T4P/T4SS family [Candidatus Diapherotrites archaeon]|nr:ATPase, T2SS/T4P/T4SS family [Candidatus Diapherotrites archaeon]
MQEKKASTSKDELIESYGQVTIYNGFPYKLYSVKTNMFTNEQQRFIDFLSSAVKRSYSIEELSAVMPIESAEDFAERFNREIVQTIEVNQLLTKLPSDETYKELQKAMLKLFNEFFPDIEKKEEIISRILGDSVGYSFLEPFMEDENLEEIMINGKGKPVFVFHKKYGTCKTNVIIETEQTLYRLISRIAGTIGKAFDEEHPLLDARLPGGSRVNATFKSVTPFGYTLTIRKFNKNPISIIELIEKRTLSPEVAAFLWLAVEGIRLSPANMIISGGAGSGKTTLLNALCSFIRPEERIICIEDTLELDLGERENIIQLESRPKIMNLGEVSMDDLLKNALRMRPDRLIVGEVRGEEAQTMFVAMDTGHKGLLGTLHSNTAREMILRLKSAPMNVPLNMIPLLDISVIMFKVYTKQHGLIRRVREVAEIEHMEEKILLSNVYEWNKRKDTIDKTDVPSRLLDKFAEATGLTKSEIMQEVEIRQHVLEWMLANKINKWAEVQDIINQYYTDPKGVLDKVFKH